MRLGLAHFVAALFVCVGHFNTYRMRQNEGKKDQLVQSFEVWGVVCIVFSPRLFLCLEGWRGRASSTVALHSAVCEDKLQAILLIQTDSDAKGTYNSCSVPSYWREQQGRWDVLAYIPLMSQSVHVGGELMWRDVAKFIEEPGRDGERGVIDWPFAHLHWGIQRWIWEKGFNAPEAHLSANFPAQSSVRRCHVSIKRTSAVFIWLFLSWFDWFQVHVSMLQWQKIFLKPKIFFLALSEINAFDLNYWVQLATFQVSE